jgi:hypothetical protein
MRSLRSMSITLVILATGLAGACGGGSDVGSYSGVVSCTISESAGDGLLLQLCEDITGYSAQQAQQVEQACSQMLGLPDAGLSAEVHGSFQSCSHVHALGACKLTMSGLTVTEWYYDDGSGLQTSASIQTICAGIGASFVPA